MKSFFACALVLVLISVPAFAAKNSQSVTLRDTVTVGSTQLPAGQYKVTWTGTGSAAQVTLKQQNTDHPATVTVSAKLIDEKHDRSQLIINSQGGANTLQTIQLDRVSLVLASTPAPGQ